MTAPALRIVGLDKSFAGTSVLRGVSLEVAERRLVTILGASGSGKTTLLRLICGFERADGGTISIGGRDVASPALHLPTERRQVGYVAQEGALFPHLTVADNVLFGLRRRERGDVRRATALLERVGLPSGYATRAPHQLSGGEQQRVALARALAPNPRLVLLDEPFSALDAALRVETRLAVAQCLADADATAILVTHDQAEALSMGQEVGVLRRGMLVQVGSPGELYRRPVDVELARFLGEAVLLRGQASGRGATCCLGSIDLGETAFGTVDLLIRPEQLRLGGNGVPATVEAVRYYGHDASVGLRLSDGTIVTARVPGHAIPAIGAVVSLRVDGVALAFAC